MTKESQQRRIREGFFNSLLGDADADIVIVTTASRAVEGNRRQKDEFIADFHEFFDSASRLRQLSLKGSAIYLRK